jgi:fructokinase
VRYRANGERDFVYNIATSAAARFEWTPPVEALVHRAGHLHVMGSALSMSHAGQIIEKAAQAIKARGGTISLDPNLRKEIHYDDETRERFARIMSAADMILPSGDELEHAAGIRDESAAIAHLFEIGVREIVLKRGAKGATSFCLDGTIVDAPAFIVEERDPTGAGDCFGAAYVTCRRLGMAVDQSLTYACAAGARNVTVLGPMEGAGTRPQLDDFIENTRRHS